MARSKTYLRVYCRLIGAAQSRSILYYSDVADEMHLPHAGNYTGKMVGRMLGNVALREQTVGRPMLTAVVVSSVTKQPGAGFYDLAEEFGHIPRVASDQERRAFWESERQRVYEVWTK
jgi:hypothetical protein